MSDTPDPAPVSSAVSPDFSTDFSPPRKKRGGPVIYPFADMAIGEILTVTWETGNPPSAKCAASHAGKRLGRRFTTRTTPDGIEIERVW